MTAAYVDALTKRAREMHANAKAPSTRVAYGKDWAAFTRWCVSMGADPYQADEGALIAYVAHLDNLGVAHSTVVRHLAAIRWAHSLNGASLQTGDSLRDVVRGHVREHGRAATAKAQGLRTRDVARIVESMDLTRPRDVRDRAIILLGFVGGFRRSELAALRVDDFEDHDDGLQVTVRRSKADQEGWGMVKAVPFGTHPATCPVAAVKAWLTVSGVQSGRVFLAVRKNGVAWGSGITDQVVADVVHDRASAVGLKGKWSGHSLRRGFATEAASKGVPRHQIMKDGGWTSSAVDVYIEAGSRFKDRAGSKLGL